MFSPMIHHPLHMLILRKAKTKDLHNLNTMRLKYNLQQVIIVEIAIS